MSVKKTIEQGSELEAYELMVIIKSVITEDARGKVQEKLTKLIEKLGGKITSTDVWGKKHLAYKIDGQSEGYYIVYKVSLPQSKANDFETGMKLNTDIIRHLLIQEKNL